MLNFSQPIKDEISRKRGTQPILVLEVDWVDGNTTVYSDTKYSGAIPKIISVGNIDAVGNSIINGNFSNSISVTLDATDESVEYVFRNNDIHLRPVRLYLGFKDTTEKALLFDGLVNSEVVWDEGDRTLKFDVLNKLEDSLVGFAMEDGNFPKVGEDDRGKNWPLVFGKVCHYQTQRLTTTIKGFLLQGQGVPDPTLPPRICQIERTQCPEVRVKEIQQDRFGNDIEVEVTRKDENCLHRKRNEGCVLKDVLAQQRALEFSSFDVRNGEEFPQNQNIRIRVGTVSYEGVMNGNTFTINKTFHPDQNKVPTCREILSPGYAYRGMIGSEEEANKCTNHGKRNQIMSGADFRNCYGWIFDGASQFPTGQTVQSLCGYGAGGDTLQQTLVGGSSSSWEYYDSMTRGRFIWLSPGTDVVLEQFTDDLVYTVSLVPGTVTQVLGYRRVGDQSVLTQVPTTWYTVEEVDYGGYTVVELRFNTLPSSSEEPGWSDDIIVSFVSSVGPNPVDVIEWLVDTYTDLSVDSANFASIKSKLTEFEANFVVDGRPSVLQLINDIAYQFRMAIRITNGVVHLTLLSEEPTPVRTFTSADIVRNSFKMSYTATEDLRTNHRVKWKREYMPNLAGKEVEKELLIRYNIPRYGTVDLDQNWFTQNTFETVSKTSTFWLIRKANTWTEVEFTTSIEHLDLEVFDSVNLNIPDFPANTKVVLLEKNYNTEDNTITWRAWTPIRAGEQSAFKWAWPSTVSSGVWPLYDDKDQEGDGSGLVVTPPVGHPLRAGYVDGESKPSSSGDSFPSDVGFTAPSVICTSPLGNEIQFVSEPAIEPLARQSFAKEMKEKEEGQKGGISVNTERITGCSTGPVGYNPCPPERKRVGDEPEPEEFDPEDPPNCTYTVRLLYIYPTLVRRDGCTGPCVSSGVGTQCAGDFVWETTIVSNQKAAQTAVTNHIAAAQRVQDNCAHEIGEKAPAFGGNYKGTQVEGSVWFNTESPAGICPEEQENLPPVIIQNPFVDEADADTLGDDPTTPPDLGSGA